MAGDCATAVRLSVAGTGAAHGKVVQDKGFCMHWCMAAHAIDVHASFLGLVARNLLI